MQHDPGLGTDQVRMGKMCGSAGTVVHYMCADQVMTSFTFLNLAALYFLHLVLTLWEHDYGPCCSALCNLSLAENCKHACACSIQSTWLLTGDSNQQRVLLTHGANRTA